MQEAAHLDVFWIVVDDDRGLEDALSQVALVLTGEINAISPAPHHPSSFISTYTAFMPALRHSGGVSPATILRSCLLLRHSEGVSGNPRSSSFHKEAAKGAGTKCSIARTTTVVTRLSH